MKIRYEKGEKNMTLFVIYLFISGLGFPITMGLLISNIKKSKRKENVVNDRTVHKHEEL